MRFGGYQKMTLLDFPGKVACTVFTLGCNFLCPFCHNSALVVNRNLPEVAESEILAFLKKRQGLLDGAAITGGEPMLHPDLPAFIARVRDLGFAVKLDTNGAFPDRLRKVLADGLVDYVAMDVKNCPDKYARTCGTDRFLPQVEESIRLLLDGKTEFEFRTTLVNELHEPEDFDRIGRWIQGAERYFIQGFVDSGDILAPGMHAASKEKAQACLAAVLPWVPSAQLRGLD